LGQLDEPGDSVVGVEPEAPGATFAVEPVEPIGVDDPVLTGGGAEVDPDLG
jgi:hypothetical protein